VTAIQVSFLILWLASVIFYALSAYCVSSYYKRAGKKKAETAVEELPPVSVMKPVKGADYDTYENLKSFVMQDYPRYQVVFGVADEGDPAVGLIKRLIAENPGKDLSLTIGSMPVGANHKICNLDNMYKNVYYSIVIIADSDMRVGPDYLREVVRGFDGPDVGLVTCPYRGAYPEDIGATFEALTIDTDFMPSVAVAERLEGLSFAMGATMAVRREALEKIGGFGALADYLADDYKLGNLVMKAGYSLRLSGYVVDSVGRRETIGSYLSHQLRWGRTYRACRPKGYFLSVLTKGTAFSVFFLLATGFSQAGWALFTANLLVRYAQAYYMEAVYIKGPGVLRLLWLLPVKDLLGFAVWLLSFTGSTVRWKDVRFRVDKEGRMVEVP